MVDTDSCREAAPSKAFRRYSPACFHMLLNSFRWFFGRIFMDSGYFNFLTFELSNFLVVIAESSFTVFGSVFKFNFFVSCELSELTFLRFFCLKLAYQAGIWNLTPQKKFPLKEINFDFVLPLTSLKWNKNWQKKQLSLKKRFRLKKTNIINSDRLLSCIDDGTFPTYNFFSKPQLIVNSNTENYYLKTHTACQFA